MMVSNCWAAGADARVTPITGAVVRADPVTKIQEVAAVRPNGVPKQDDLPTKVADVKGVTLSPSAMAAVLGFEG